MCGSDGEPLGLDVTGQIHNLIHGSVSSCCLSSKRMVKQFAMRLICFTHSSIRSFMHGHIYAITDIHILTHYPIADAHNVGEIL